MKICRITEKVLPIYLPYIPEYYQDVCRNRNYIGLGIYDDDGAYGAAVVQEREGLVEILSIAHTDLIEDGICEKLVTDLILEQEQWEVFRIVYVVELESVDASAYDQRMLELGYFPSAGDVEKYTGKLGDIFRSQETAIRTFTRKMEKGSVPVVRADEASTGILGQHNQKFRENPYRPQAFTPELSYFYMKEGEPAGSMFVKETENGELILEWMNQRGNNPHMVLNLAFAAIANAAAAYDRETPVSAYPFSDAVRTVLKRFGMKPDTSYTKETRIYTMYI